MSWSIFNLTFFGMEIIILVNRGQDLPEGFTLISDEDVQKLLNETNTPTRRIINMEEYD